MIYRIIDWFGFAVCHQLPERTLHYGTLALPVCARCTGIYIGMLAGFIFLFVVNRKHEYGFPPWWALLVGACGIILMGIDGVTSYGGFRPTTNELRLITGLMAGSALPMVLVPIFNYQAWKESSEQRIIKGWRDFLLYLGVIGAVLVFFQYRPVWLFWPLYLINGLAVIFAFVYVNMILVMLVPWWAQKAERLRDLIVPIGVAAVVAFGELAASYFMHWYLLSKLLAK